MKKSFSNAVLLAAFFLSFCCWGCNHNSQSTGGHRSYYLDANRGNDQADGRSEATPWKSFERLQQVALNPGDQVLLRRGSRFEGVLDIQAQGTAQHPVVIGAYGEGTEKPVVSAPDSSLFTVRIFNSDYVTLQDLEIVNRGSTDLAYRTGVKVESMNYGVSKGIRLNRLFIRDVNGVITKWDGGGSGILVVNGGKEKISVFDSLTIEYCHIKDCQRNAMIWDGYADRSNWHPSTHVWVHHNLIEGVPGDGIVPIGCDGAIIEYNVMRRGVNTMLLSNREAAAGMWPWGCDNTVIRCNEVSEHKGKWDGQGFDADYNCVNTIIEYNYSHGNDGGMVLICSSGEEDRTSWCIGTEKPIVRYNISIGDGNRDYQTRGKWFSPSIHVAGPVRDALIYRNIIHNKVKAAPEIDRSMLVADDWDGFAQRLTVKENIFYAPEVSRFDFGESVQTALEGNYYLGKYSQLPDEKGMKSLAPEVAKVIENPGAEGLMQLMDSVTVAGGAQCVFVNKEKVEAFFNQVYGR